MTTNNIHPSAKKDIQEAWRRLLNNSYTSDDLSLILESLKDDNDFQEFYETSDKEWELSVNIQQLETEAQREEYRLQAAKLLADYERMRQNRRMKPSQISLRKRKYSRIICVLVLLCVAVSSVFFYFLKPGQLQNIDVQYIEVATNRGEIRTITLPDSSKVILNANSNIRYPRFFAKDERSVKLQGEASFDVIQNPAQPFVVKTNSSTVKVLGTFFDIKEYQEDQHLLVTVVSGKVQVNLANGQALLGQDQQLKLDKATGNFEKQNVNARKYLSWADGKLYFNKTPLREVVNMLNRHYPSLNIELAEGDYPNIITGEHDNKSVEAILTSIIYSTGIKYRKENNKIILY